MKNKIGRTSKFILSLTLLLVASAWGGTRWSRSQSARHQVIQFDMVAQTSHAPIAIPDAATRARLNEAYGQLPLSFEANAGQADRQVDFISRGSGHTLFLTSGEAVMALRPASAPATTRGAQNDHESAAATVLRMKLVGSQPKPRVTGEDELPGKINYLIGKDSKRWRTGISTYAKVSYQDLYPGVDLVYYGNQRQLEYDFIVRPGTDPDIIALSFDGADQLKIDAQGELVLHARGMEVRQRKPLIYQEVDGVRREVAGSYKLKARNTVGFQLADYDASRPLVIDPVLVYSTFLGGTDFDEGVDIAVDVAGNAYVTGVTSQLTPPPNFPTTPGAFDTAFNGGSFDAYVTKLNASGSALVYSTFLGGSDDDFGGSIAVDATGNAYVIGSTSSGDFPTTPGAFDTTYNGFRDAFVTKLNPTGSALVYSTFLGGFESDVGSDIALDSAGNAYVAGSTISSSFPTTPGAFDTSPNTYENSDIFVTKFNAAGSALVYSTLLGGNLGANNPSIAVDSAGSAYVTGTTHAPDFPTTVGAFDTTHNFSADAFVTKFNVTGSALIYSTFLGGSISDSGGSIAVDTSGSAYVTGDTTSPDFPTTTGAFDTTFNGGFSDIYVTKFNPAGSALVYSTFLGGGGQDNSQDIAVDNSGNAYVTGATLSSDFPTTVDAFDTTYNGAFDVFVTKLNPSGSAPLIYSTFLGGSNDDTGRAIALDVSGGAYVSGSTRAPASPIFPTTVGAFDTSHNGGSDAFVLKLDTSSPSDPIDALISQVRALVAAGTLTENQGSGLIDKLEQVRAKIDNGQTTAACNQLRAFINQVKAFTKNGPLTGAQGQALIDAADAIRDGLGC